MKIGIDARMLGTNHGGIGRYVFELLKNLLALGGRNEFLVFYNQDGGKEIQVLGRIAQAAGQG